MGPHVAGVCDFDHLVAGAFENSTDGISQYKAPEVANVERFVCVGL